jgi:hypothetical protein
MMPAFQWQAVRQGPAFTGFRGFLRIRSLFSADPVESALSGDRAKTTFQ